jgi:squalene synthase HpnC
LAVYGFARLVDDLGDEAPGDRSALLDWVESELDRAVGGSASDPVLSRLTPTIQACSLPIEALHRLIEANRRDQMVTSYSSWDELREYCRYSADPIGRLVLAIFGMATPERIAWSDDVCTGLQLIEHLQDVGEDARRGRVYLPADDLARFGCATTGLTAPSASEALRGVVEFEVRRAAALLDSSLPLVATLPGRARLAIAGFAAGGRAALDAIVRARYDVLATQCRPRRSRTVRHLLQIARSS